MTAPADSRISDEMNGQSAGHPIEQLLIDAYVRGVEWCEENPLDREYRFKAARDYADKALTVLASLAPQQPLTELRERRAQAVVVKPLEWEDRRIIEGVNWAWDAKTSIGWYIVATASGEGCKGTHYWLIAGGTVCGWANSEAEAKAAAFDNYKSRILSAIAAPPPAQASDYWKEQYDIAQEQLLAAKALIEAPPAQAAGVTEAAKALLAAIDASDLDIRRHTYPAVVERASDLRAALSAQDREE